FFLDGFALAAESLTGMAVGSADMRTAQRGIRYSFELGAVTSIILAVTFFTLGPLVIDLLTNIESVVLVAMVFLPWAIAAPVVSFSCYLLDGIFIGATRTSEMRNAMIFSLAGYLAIWSMMEDRLGNHGLWASLMIFFLLRAISLAFYLPAISGEAQKDTR
ncbi:MAG: MATE family efflux transporter, partial [Gammaproteobacteria bacterium]|nr:MATE family efflux transporter [Gammaproteobacteria bacterium]